VWRAQSISVSCAVVTTALSHTLPLSIPFHVLSPLPHSSSHPPLSYFIEIGSLAKFKSKTSSVIILGKEPDATSREKCNGLAASEQLRTLLSKIMMRRTQAEILKRLLPPRTDYIGEQGTV
jgi:hypothetical protein